MDNAESIETLGAREKMLHTAITTIKELVPNARDSERPTGFTLQYDAWQHVMGILCEDLAATQNQIMSIQCRQMGH